MTARNKNIDWTSSLYEIQTEDQTSKIIVSGRDRWALEELMASGSKGCTPIENPAPRWSAYVFNLRELGVEVETISEPHDGEFPGHHGRYVLRSRVVPGWNGGDA